MPAPTEMDNAISAIFIALRKMRGFNDFISPGKSLRCDFFVPGERLIVEYDERQHFTEQRAKALELYPTDLRLGFDREKWIAACQTIKATDPTPPHRDEQRAFLRQPARHPGITKRHPADSSALWYRRLDRFRC